MPEGLMVQARHVPPALMVCQSKASYTSSGLSLGPPRLVEECDKSPAGTENDLDKMKESEEIEYKSGSENIEGGAASGEDQDGDQRSRKKRYHRHTQHQIQELEMFFRECPHPDDKQRQELSRRLCLEPRQIKFWFQNKRTQMKAHHERQENTALKADNEKLRMENIRYREALSNISCPNCGGPAALGEMSFDEQQLRIENARLRDEVDRISAIAAKYVGKPLPSSMSSAHLNVCAIPGPVPVPCSTLELGSGSGFGDFHEDQMDERQVGVGIGIGVTESEKPMVVEVAVAAMEELVQMAQLGDPLWTSPLAQGLDETFCYDEYLRMFPRSIESKSYGMKTEASRQSVVVIMNAVNLVETLMDVNQWSTMFSCIVSRAFTMEILSTGVAGNCNGALQVMFAEFQVPSPLVPTRENLFVRYCKEHSDGIWAVVDVSLDSLRATATGILPPYTSTSSSTLRSCRRRPSGCLIHEMPNGYSKVTWVEHVEVDERPVHRIYEQLVISGMAFGAKRWVATLERQCERLASVLACNIPSRDLGVIQNPEGRRSMLKLAERMTNSFCAGVSASNEHTWTTLSGSGAEDVRVMTRKSIDDPGRPPGIVLSAATSFWLPQSPSKVFHFLRDDNLRNEWDILSNGGLVQEMAHIANGQDSGNCVSLLRVNNTNSNQSNMLILQECSTDASGSFVVYAPVDIAAMNVVLNGADPDYVALLPSGFAILPDGSHSHYQLREKVPPPDSGGGGGGSLLTVAFQILVDSVPTAKLSLGSVATVNSLISCTVERIKKALNCENT